MITITGTAKIKHKNTGEIYLINADELGVDCVESHERNMGKESHYLGEMEHDELGDLEFNWWEYPEGAFNTDDYQINGHTIIEKFNVEVRADSYTEMSSMYDDDADVYENNTDLDSFKNILSAYKRGEKIENKLILEKFIDGASKRWEKSKKEMESVPFSVKYESSADGKFREVSKGTLLDEKPNAILPKLISSVSTAIAIFKQEEERPRNQSLGFMIEALQDYLVVIKKEVPFLEEIFLEGAGLLSADEKLNEEFVSDSSALEEKSRKIWKQVLDIHLTLLDRNAKGRELLEDSKKYKEQSQNVNLIFRDANAIIESVEKVGLFDNEAIKKIKKRVNRKIDAYGTVQKITMDAINAIISIIIDECINRERLESNKQEDKEKIKKLLQLIFKNRFKIAKFILLDSGISDFIIELWDSGIMG